VVRRSNDRRPLVNRFADRICDEYLRQVLEGARKYGLHDLIVIAQMEVNRRIKVQEAFAKLDASHDPEDAR